MKLAVTEQRGKLKKTVMKFRCHRIFFFFSSKCTNDFRYVVWSAGFWMGFHLGVSLWFMVFSQHDKAWMLFSELDVFRCPLQ